MSQRKIGDKVKVSSYNDNENYDDFRNKVLIITHVTTSTDNDIRYSKEMGGSLYDFEDEDGNEIPCALYDYELERIWIMTQTEIKN